jgi:hypothetical protein
MTGSQISHARVGYSLLVVRLLKKAGETLAHTYVPLPWLPPGAGDDTEVNMMTRTASTTAIFLMSAFTCRPYSATILNRRHTTSLSQFSYHHGSGFTFAAGGLRGY